MNELIQHIRHILFSTGSVAVGRLGVFMLSHRSSSFSSDSALNAPYLTVSFTSGDSTGNADLISSYMRAGNIGREEARTAVEAATDALFAELNAGRPVLIPDAGSLSLDSDSGIVSFTPMGNHWLPTLALRPIEIKSAVSEAADAADDIWMEERRRNLFRAVRRTASSAAAIAVFVVLAFLVSRMPGRSNGAAQVAGFGMEQATTEPDEPLIAAPGASKPTLVLVLNTPADGVAPAKVRYRDVRPAEPQAPGRYCLVVGSLASKAEADKFISAHSTTEMPLSLLENEGRWRVYALSAPSIEELQVAARNLGAYDAFPSAWICRR